MTAGLVFLACSFGAAAERTPAEWFAAGVAARHDSAAARTAFAHAADGFDARWQLDEASRTPELALARARSHALTGHVPFALAAVHDGLTVAPFDLELQRDLLALRSQVAYPDSAEPTHRLRADPPRGLRDRVAPWEPFVFAAGCSLVATVGWTRFFTTRPPWAFPTAVLASLGIAVAAGVAWSLHAADPPRVLVVATETPLRRGNGLSYPPRIAEALPRGCEVAEVGRRGGWVQVRVAGGAVGWLPESHLVR